MDRMEFNSDWGSRPDNGLYNRNDSSFSSSSSSSSSTAISSSSSMSAFSRGQISDHHLNQQQQSVLVRVKRARNQEPSDSLVLISSSSPSRSSSESRPLKVAATLTKKANDNSSAETEYSSSLGSIPSSSSSFSSISGSALTFLRRIGTVDANGSLGVIDSETVKLHSNLPSSSSSSSSSSSVEVQQHDSLLPRTSGSSSSASLASSTFSISKERSVYISNGSKVINTSGVRDKSSSIFLVDLSQVATSPTSSFATAVSSKSLDPRFAMLDSAITHAWMTGDFTLVSQAIQDSSQDKQQFNHRCLEFGGKTALMASIFHCNIRIFVRLIDLGVDIFAMDNDGSSAIDLFYSGLVSTNADLSCRLRLGSLLNKHAAKQFVDNQYKSSLQNNTNSDRSSSNSNSTAEDKDEKDFIFDIFESIPAPLTTSTSADTLGPIIDVSQLNGFNLKDSTSNPNLIPTPTSTARSSFRANFEYDQDWDDLGESASGSEVDSDDGESDLLEDIEDASTVSDGFGHIQGNRSNSSSSNNNRGNSMFNDDVIVPDAIPVAISSNSSGNYWQILNRIGSSKKHHNLGDIGDSDPIQMMSSGHVVPRQLAAEGQSGVPSYLNNFSGDRTTESLQAIWNQDEGDASTAVVCSDEDSYAGGGGGGGGEERGYEQENRGDNNNFIGNEDDVGVQDGYGAEDDDIGMYSNSNSNNNDNIESNTYGDDLKYLNEDFENVNINTANSSSSSSSSSILGNFASNASEFARFTGLPKNGYDLSDDEMTNEYDDQYASGFTRKAIGGCYLYDPTIKPPSGTVAYDSDLDRDD